MKTRILTIVVMLAMTIGFSAQSLFAQRPNTVGDPAGIVQDNNNGNVYKLLDFSAVPSFDGPNGYTSYIKWTAEGETQIKGYDIERMRATMPKLWVVAASFPSSDKDVLITRSYQESFAAVGPFILFYRLKIYFNDGTVQYTPAIKVTFGSLANSMPK